jgi:hypothetical protein
MNIFVTFDYELCFGTRTGTAEKCILEPTHKLIDLAKQHQAHFTFFVDVLYLMKLKEYAFIKALKEELEAVQDQIKALIKAGHDVQLHLHTHWINASYETGKWTLDYSRYRIHTFSDREIEGIVDDSVRFLEELTEKRVFAFRAGGWCLQPFDKLKNAFLKKGIWLDSTVFYKGYNKTPTNLFDFRTSSDLDIWKFDDDPMQVVEHGTFTELPISSCAVSPLFYWRMAFVNKLNPKAHTISGDGTFLRNNKWQMLRLLLAPSHTVASCDGYRSSLLEATFKEYEADRKANFVVIGHPKLMSLYSKQKLESFITKATQKGHRFTSISEVFDADGQSETAKPLGLTHSQTAPR